MRYLKGNILTIVAFLAMGLISAEATPLKWNMQGIGFCQGRKSVEKTVALMQLQNLKPECLSTYIMISCLMGVKGMDDYQVDIAGGMDDPVIMAESLKRNKCKSMISRKEISNVRWNKSDESNASGQFSVKTKYGFSATLLFEAKKQGRVWGITRLAVANKIKLGIENGYKIFDEKGPGKFTNSLPNVKISSKDEEEKRRAEMLKGYKVLQKKAEANKK